MDEITELQVAEKIRDGILPSPQQFGNIHLFAMRISGTGVSYRAKDDEFVYRDPALYLTDEFMARCNGLPVIIEHPPENMLNSEEFSKRVIGTILLPYLVDGEEKSVWGIAKIYDDAASQMMIENQLSTSPAVVWKTKNSNGIIELDDGSVMLVEGKPSLVDHLAVVPQGVWDKGGEPSGVLIEKESSMTVENKEAEKEPKDFPEVEKKPEAEFEAKKDDGGDVMAALAAIMQRLEKLETGEKAEEVKEPGIHEPAKDESELPAAPLPAAGQPAPTAADDKESEPKQGKAT